MLRYLLVFTLLISQWTFSQIKFEDKQLENGLTYPQLVTTGDSSAYALINSDIYSGIKDLEESGFCVSNYGYVQKGNHLQIQLMCSCMEMDKGEIRLFFYNLQTGKKVKYSDLFEEKEREKALKLIDDKIKAHVSSTSPTCADAFNQLGDNIKFDELEVKLTREGLELTVPDSDACDSTPVSISWTDLKTFLKYNFL